MSDNPPPPPPPSGGPPPDGYGAAPPPGGYGGYAKAGNNGKALWSLILGIVGLVFCGVFTGIPAIILGRMAQGEIAESGGAQSGSGMAKAGLILGIIACAWGVIAIILVTTGAIALRGASN
ncbi:MAG: DUF4190 domain-containing protein [Marmoricola sp.]